MYLQLSMDAKAPVSSICWHQYALVYFQIQIFAQFHTMWPRYYPSSLRVRFDERNFILESLIC